ncbi:MAG: putative ATP-dependent serine protease [Oceanicoccus sp.]|jgi:predicted ATP-dependent serine protease
MSYHCRDCSLKQKGAFPNGKCPACGSFNIVGRQVEQNSDQGIDKKKWRLMVLVLSWGSLLFLLFQKFNANS